MQYEHCKETPRTEVVEWNISWSGPPLTSTPTSITLIINAPIIPAWFTGSREWNEDFDVYPDGERKETVPNEIHVLLLAEQGRSYAIARSLIFLLVIFVSEKPPTVRRIGLARSSRESDQKRFKDVEPRIVHFV